MKTRNLFFIPFLISNCHKIPQNTKRDDTKIEQVKNKILENYEHSKQTSSGNSIIEQLKFNDSILDFGCYDKVTDVIFDFNTFYYENKRYFKFLCDFDFSKADECEKAKSEFKTLVKNLTDSVNSNDPSCLSVILGQLIYIFENLDNVEWDKVFEESDIEKSVVANVLNFVASVYCLKNYKKFFFDEIKSENSRQSSLDHDILVAKNNGIGGEKNITDIKSPCFQDEKLAAVRSFSGNAPLCDLFDTKDNDKNPHIFRENIKELVKDKEDKDQLQKEALKQIINLAANIKHFAQDPNFDFAGKLTELLKYLNDASIEKNITYERVKILDCICDICKEISQTTPRINADGFRILTSKLKSTIDSVDMWRVFIDACNTDQKSNKVNEIKDNKKKYSEHVVGLLTDRLLNSPDLITKTLNLLPDQSLDHDKFLELLGKIYKLNENFSKPEDTENLFRLLDFESFKNKDEFSNTAAGAKGFCLKVSSFFGYSSICINRATFVGLIEYLKKLKAWDGDDNIIIRSCFGFADTVNGKTFVLRCNDDEKSELIKEYGL